MLLFWLRTSHDGPTTKQGAGPGFIQSHSGLTRSDLKLKRWEWKELGNVISQQKEEPKHPHRKQERTIRTIRSN